MLTASRARYPDSSPAYSAIGGGADSCAVGFTNAFDCRRCRSEVAHAVRRFGPPARRGSSRLRSARFQGALQAAGGRRYVDSCALWWLADFLIGVVLGKRGRSATRRKRLFKVVCVFAAPIRRYGRLIFRARENWKLGRDDLPKGSLECESTASGGRASCRRWDGAFRGWRTVLELIEDLLRPSRFIRRVRGRSSARRRS